MTTSITSASVDYACPPPEDPAAVVLLRLSSSPSCGKGFFCSNLDPSDPCTYPTFYSPSPTCALERLSTIYCAKQGPYEPEICPGGFYCDPSSSPQALPVICPRGHYCPLGSSFPRPCPSYSLCGEAGKETAQHYGLLILCLLVDFIIIAAYLSLSLRPLLASAVWPIGASSSSSSSSSSSPPRAFETRKGGGAEGESGEKVAEQVAVASVAVGVREPSSADLLISEIAAAQGALFQSGDAEAGFSLVFEAVSVAVGLGGGPAAGGVLDADASREPRGAAESPASDDEKVEDKWSPFQLKYALRECSGVIAPRKLTAIMGPSGAGKSTLLNALLGRLELHDGTIYTASESGGVTPASFKTFKNLVGHVPQDDCLLPMLSVREHLLYSGSTRLPRSWSAARVSAFVALVEASLDLTHVAGSLVGDDVERGISGGERKRLAIGIELCAAPAAIFLDEPTSGLDAAASLHVAKTLKRLATLGITVVTVIHQPRVEIFDLVDDLILLDKGGLMVYSGCRAGLFDFLYRSGVSPTQVLERGSNPADVMLDLLASRRDARIAGAGAAQSSSHAAIDKLRRAGHVGCANAARCQIECPNRSDPDEHPQCSCKVMRVSDLKSTASNLTRSFDPPRVRRSWLGQAYGSLSRSLLQQARQPVQLRAELFLACLSGFLMGMNAGGAPSIFSGVLIAPYSLISPAPTDFLCPLMGFFVCLTIGVASGPPGVRVLGDELNVFRRETSSGHSPSAYFIGKMLSVLPRIVLVGLHFTAVFVFLLAPQAKIWVMFCFVMLLGYCVYGLSSIVSVIASRANAALSAAIFAMALGSLCGYSPSLNDAGGVLRWFYACYGVEAFYGSEVTAWKEIYDIEYSRKKYGFVLGQPGFDFGMMVAVGTAYRIIAFALLVGVDASTKERFKAKARRALVRMLDNKKYN